MSEHDRIIAGMSDVELLLFHRIGGRVPVAMAPRLERALASALIEQHVPLPPVYHGNNIGGAAVPSGNTRWVRQRTPMRKLTKRKARMAA
jgi:hypothetical protein